MPNLKLIGGIDHHNQQHERLKYWLSAAILFENVVLSDQCLVASNAFSFILDILECRMGYERGIEKFVEQIEW